MWRDLWIASSLLMVIEGIVPFLTPTHTRRTLYMLAELNDRTLRLGGLASMVLGVLALYMI